jgi:hypothetical protein
VIVTGVLIVVFISLFPLWKVFNLSIKNTDNKKWCVSRGFWGGTTRQKLSPLKDNFLGA